jgi:hypothetical protein
LVAVAVVEQVEIVVLLQVIKVGMAQILCLGQLLLLVAVAVVDMHLVLALMVLTVVLVAVAEQQMAVFMAQQQEELALQVKEIMEQEIKVLLAIGKLAVVVVQAVQQPMLMVEQGHLHLLVLLL